MQINKQTFLAGLSCILSVVILTTTIPIAFKGEKEMATIITIANGDAGSVVRGAINDNFSEVNSELETDTTAIGTLASLTTTAKTNLVAAVNEVQANKVQSIYGEMRKTTSSLYTHLLTLENTYYVLSPSSLGAVSLSGITFDTNKLTISEAGKYLVTYSCTTYMGEDSVITSAIMKNGASVDGTRMTKSLKTSEYQTYNCSTIVDLSASDYLQFGFSKVTAPSVIVYVAYFTMTITKV